MFLPQQETKNSKFACRFCNAKQSIVKVGRVATQSF